MQKELFKRTLKEELTFYGIPLTQGRHKIHPYPAMLHPSLVDYLIKKYAKEKDIIFDPFCGSGVTLLQAGLNNHNAHGFDINPLALLIAKVKTQNYEKALLLEDIEKIKTSLKEKSCCDVPNIKNMNYWYSDEVISDLGRLRFILKNQDFNYKDFLIACFAFICRNQSFTRNGEFKRYRIKSENISKTQNNVFEKFFLHTSLMIEHFVSVRIPNVKLIPKLINSEKNHIEKLEYDFVLTSPPYGDSRTTVAYGEYSSFGMEWTEDINPFGKISYKIDKESLGKKGMINDNIFKSKIFSDTIAKIDGIDKKRAEDVVCFFNGFYNVVNNVVTGLNKQGRTIFVVGNRTVKGVQIQMDQITSEFLNNLGMQFENIFVRNIVSKIMPSKNSPTNVKGETVNTMHKEYVVNFIK